MTEAREKNLIEIKKDIIAEANEVLTSFNKIEHQVIFLDKHIELYETSVLEHYYNTRATANSLYLSMQYQTGETQEETERLISLLQEQVIALRTQIERVLCQGSNFLILERLENEDDFFQDSEPNV